MKPAKKLFVCSRCGRRVRGNIYKREGGICFRYSVQSGQACGGNLLPAGKTFDRGRELV